MRIILTVNVAWNIWNFRKSLLEALIEDGHAVTILAPPDDTVEKLRGLGCDFEPLEMSRKGLNPVEDIALCLRLRRIFKRLNPDIVLSFTIKNNLFGAFASRGMQHAFIPNVTGLGTAFLSGGPMRMLAKALYRFAFARLPVVFFQNEDDIALFTQRKLVRPYQAKALPGSGIDLDHFAAAPFPEETPETTFLMVARLLRDKGVVEFVDAARSVKQAVPGARFQLLGAIDPHNRSAIDRETLDGWVAENVIEYLGTTNDIRPNIAAAHCVVLPSYREGAPRTLIEASAMARPVIATDVPGCRSVVEDAKTGLLCEAKSSASLAQSMLEFLAFSRAEQAAMGRTAREKMVSGYSDQIVIGRYREQIAAVSNDVPVSLDKVAGK
ncbi:glycosyltransferase family 4 protein [Pontixanthobacter aquaemixtae]|uniref:Glycosyltransferase n=1 Tax=Pontixanthobacter aquaemixtae TaxID=1958940 RepID=A0A844ZWL8_9SPHN|nr:glycosyltransferase family 4 protein [Pontixanthobacter aquaemixtae]MXO91346.1 glycosyltransferase [Pontixanthobacter aquaemixtae]